MNNLVVREVTPVVEARQQTQKYNNLIRQVRFHFEQIIHPKFGETTIRGGFPSIRARVQRPKATADNLQDLKSILVPWLKRFFNLACEPKYFEQAVETTCIFVYYTYPFPALGDVRIGLALKVVGYMYVLDDMLERWLSPESKDACSILRAGSCALMSVLQENDAAFVPVDGFPIFSELFHSLVDIRKSFHQNGYGHKLGSYCELMKRYLEALEDHTNTVDAKRSEEEFISWRNIESGGRAAIEIFWILECEELLPSLILDSRSFNVVVNHAMTLNSCVNDLLGINWELGNGKLDNLLVFKIEKKCIPIIVAVNQVCHLIEDQMASYFFSREKVVNEFKYSAGLIHYLDVLESVMAGHLYIYLHLPRYKAIGHVMLGD